ncbi:MAG TPA: POTRA domain-containing protein [Candidatus Acidoferrales bacterium]|nr:POTRA domain-containing protein [Candidatus Acidoferrales bacterium]
MKIVSRKLYSFFSAFFLVLLFVSSAIAQTPSPSGFQLMKISVTGLRQFNEPQVIAVSKLSPGQTVTLQEINAAADRLAQYGVFQNVTFHYRTRDNQMDLQFEVVETPELVSCRFDNFVWFTPAELGAQLTRDVPLYSGSVPQSGQMLKAINDSLTAMLKQKGVPGDVRLMPFSGGVGQPITAVIFSVSAVALPIREIHFPGASALAESQLEKAVKPLLGQDYTATEVNTFVSTTLVPLYSQLGYLRAHFDAAQPQVLTASANAPSQDISVIVPVVEGLSYMWKGDDWIGSRAFSADALDKLLGMHLEGVANMQKFGEGMQAVNNAYLKQGYLQLAISSQRTLDDATRHVTYQFSVDEGHQFHMGAITVTGLPDKTSRQLLKAWKLRSGNVYDGTYLTQFLKQALTEVYRSGAHVNYPQSSFHADPSTNTVNVEIAFH